MENNNNNNPKKRMFDTIKWYALPSLKHDIVHIMCNESSDS